MTLIWDNAQNYSNQSPGRDGRNAAGSPGFWFGPRTAPDWVGRFDTTLSANSQLSKAQPVYNLSVPAGATVTKPGDTFTVTVPIPDSNLKALLTVSYVGEFSYKRLTRPTPATVAEFQITNIKFTNDKGEPVDPSTTTGTQALAKAASGGQEYLYLQLVPSTGDESLKTDNPAAPGSPLTLSNVTWDYDTAVPPVEIACFLAGSMIATSAGPKAVEDLVAGDLVITGPAGAQKVEPITWVGRGHVDVQPDLPDDRAGYAVCILKGALGHDCPNADLYLTPEHTLYFQGRFVPVRMLVNHRSIFYDRSRTSFDYYHFETAEHSIIHANNVATESYLNASNRRHFREMQFLQQGNIVSFPPLKSWEKDACAPLAVDMAFVMPLYETLENRARALGLPRQKPPVGLTDDSDFHLVTNTGELLYAIRRVRDRAIFLLPENVTFLRLCSRASRPCDTIGAYVDDRRTLGVLVGTMELYQDGQTHCLTHHLTDQQASGWDVVENSPCRWTNGEAILSLEGIGPIHERDMLAIQIIAEGPYLDETQAATSTVALPSMAATH